MQGIWHGLCWWFALLQQQQRWVPALAAVAASKKRRRWSGSQWVGHPSLEAGQHVHEGPALLVDRRLCFKDEVGLVEVRFLPRRPGFCMHLAQVTFLANGSIDVVLASAVETKTDGLQVRSMGTVPIPGSSCLGLILPRGGDAPPNCGISYDDLRADEEEGQGEVEEYLWHRGLVRKYRMGSTWPVVRHQRRYVVAFKILNRSLAYTREHARAMRAPQWGALHRALHLSAEDWQSSQVHEALSAVESFLSDQENFPHSMLEMSEPSLYRSFEQPARNTWDDWWTEQFFALSTFWLLQLMRHLCSEDHNRHAERVAELYPFFQRYWGSDFALPEHRGWVPALGYYDAAAVMYREFWPIGFCPRTSSPSQELLLLSRANGLIPPPLPELAWWPVAREADPTEQACGAERLRRRGRGEHARRGLKVVIIEEHHIDFQELRALLQRVSLALFQAPAAFSAYMLQLPNTLNEAEWDSLGVPEIHGDVSAEILFVLTGAAASESEVLSWLNHPAWLEADLAAGCTPIWACAYLAHARPELPFLARQNMALLNFWKSQEDLPAFWQALHSFVTSPHVALAWKHRLGAEQVFEQLGGARPAYVPLISLHTEGTKHSPTRPEVLVHRCSHRGFEQFSTLLRLAVAELRGRVLLEFLRDHQLRGRYLKWSEFTAYHALVLVPHVPNTISFADAYAMHIPIFLPAEPEIWNWIWTQSDPYAGPGFPEKQQGAPWSAAADGPAWWRAAGGDRHHDFPAFGHLQNQYAMEAFEPKAYWFQYTEYALLPHTRRFRGIADLLRQLQDYSLDLALEDSRRIAGEQVKREVRVLSWTVGTVAEMVCHRHAETL